MPAPSEDFRVENLSRQRLADFLEILTQRGLTQQQVGARAGLPAQYLSDMKHGRRPVTELAARRLGEEFDVNHEWLLGTGSTMEPVRTNASTSPGNPGGTWLPLFPHPVEGEPRSLPEWDGTSLEVSGAAAAKVLLARWPYVLRFDRDDVRGRLRRGDLILVSQVPSDEAEISVVKYRGKLFLARPDPTGSWERAGNGDHLPETCAIAGHCLGIVWSSLLPVKGPG